MRSLRAFFPLLILIMTVTSCQNPKTLESSREGKETEGVYREGKKDAIAEAFNRNLEQQQEQQILETQQQAESGEPGSDVPETVQESVPINGVFLAGYVGDYNNEQVIIGATLYCGNAEAFYPCVDENELLENLGSSDIHDVCAIKDAVSGDTISEPYTDDIDSEWQVHFAVNPKSITDSRNFRLACDSGSKSTPIAGIEVTYPAAPPGDVANRNVVFVFSAVNNEVESETELCLARNYNHFKPGHMVPAINNEVYKEVTSPEMDSDEMPIKRPMGMNCLGNLSGDSSTNYTFKTDETTGDANFVPDNYVFSVENIITGARKFQISTFHTKSDGVSKIKHILRHWSWKYFDVTSEIDNGFKFVSELAPNDLDGLSPTSPVGLASNTANFYIENGKLVSEYEQGTKLFACIGKKLQSATPVYQFRMYSENQNAEDCKRSASGELDSWRMISYP